jgi:ribosomal protein S18 acetylase RimI-like enzyme
MMWKVLLLLARTSCLPDCDAFSPSSHRTHRRPSCPTNPAPYLFQFVNLRRGMLVPARNIHSKESDVSLHAESKPTCVIEKVLTKRRALDVKVFRGFSVSVGEFTSKNNLSLPKEISRDKQNNVTGEILSEEDVINLLMPGYDKYGRYTKLQPNQCRFDQEVYFVAIYSTNDCNIHNSTDKEVDYIDPRLFDRTNGVAGVVSAQLRQSSPFIAGSSANSTVHTNPAVQIQFPHIYIANMRVHDSLRRRGIGTGLLSACVEYAKELSVENMDSTGRTNLPLVLSVDSDNTNAVKMYENFGFEYMERNEDFCMMMLYIT